jgi:uncharacterized protein YbjQ (UPF0145 family)
VTAGLPITTTFEFPNWTITEYRGACFGLIVRSMGAAKGFLAGFESMAGGEVSTYTDLLEDSRRNAIDRMVKHALSLRANAVVGMRFDSSSIGQSLTEVVAYGTAVVVVPRKE